MLIIPDSERMFPDSCPWLASPYSANCLVRRRHLQSILAKVSSEIFYSLSPSGNHLWTAVRLRAFRHVWRHTAVSIVVKLIHWFHRRSEHMIAARQLATVAASQSFTAPRLAADDTSESSLKVLFLWWWDRFLILRWDHLTFDFGSRPIIGEICKSFIPASYAWQSLVAI